MRVKSRRIGRVALEAIRHDPVEHCGIQHQINAGLRQQPLPRLAVVVHDPVLGYRDRAPGAAVVNPGADFEGLPDLRRGRKRERELALISGSGCDRGMTEPTSPPLPPSATVPRTGATWARACMAASIRAQNNTSCATLCGRKASERCTFMAATNIFAMSYMLRQRGNSLLIWINAKARNLRRAPQCLLGTSQEIIPRVRAMRGPQRAPVPASFRATGFRQPQRRHAQCGGLVDAVLLRRRPLVAAWQPLSGDRDR